MTCAFAVRGAINKVAGVESVEVSLNQGRAVVKLKPGNAVTPEQLWQTIRKAGYTPKETQVLVRGEVPPDKLQLNVPEANRTYALEPSPDAPKALADLPRGKPVLLEATLTPAKDPSTPVPLRVKATRP